jgi:DNA modification methylase
MNNKIINGNNIELLKQFPDNHFDSIVTDPPYGLGKEPNAKELMKDWIEKGYHEISGSGFMGKEWDAFVPQPIFWKEIFRVLKPGGHILSFFGTRTYDWGVMAMRFAGFEVRDCIQWLYGCLSDDTEILTKSGYIQYHKFKKLPNFEQQEILIYDIEADIYKWEKPKWNEYNIHQDTCYRIKSDSTDQIVSRNHRCIVEREGKLVFIQAELLSQMEYMPTLSDNFFKLQESKILQSSMQWTLSGSRLEETRTQGEGSVVGGNERELSLISNGRKEPCVERGNNLSQKERVLFGSETEICEMPNGVYSNVKERWLCSGVSVSDGKAIEQTFIENGVRTSYRPQPNEQRYNESNVICNKQGTQEIRVGRSYSTTLATITPIEYSGVIFCPTVSTGCFVARRNGKIFITGNSGFPKSHNISKAINKMYGVEYDEIPASGVGFMKPDSEDWNITKNQLIQKGESTDQAKQWDGWGSALKPANEPIVLARKPLEKGLSIAENVLKWGVGAINIDGCRVGSENRMYKGSGSQPNKLNNHEKGDTGIGMMDGSGKDLEFNVNGRFPANLILTHANYQVMNLLGNIDIRILAEIIRYFYGYTKVSDLRKRKRGSTEQNKCGDEVFSDRGQNKSFQDTQINRSGNGSIKEREPILEVLDFDVPTEWLRYFEYTGENLGCECVGLKKVKGQNGGNSRAIQKNTYNDFGKNYDNTPNGEKCGFADENGEETIEEWNCHEDCPIKILDEQSGITKSSGGSVGIATGFGNNFGGERENIKGNGGLGDKGGASRFFYIAKASKSERNKGLNGFEEKFSASAEFRPNHLEKAIEGQSGNPYGRWSPIKNNHPTVKPIKLMQYLVRLITPPNGIVLDPFCGSGTTGVACKLEEFDFVGLEQDAEYCKIAQARIDNYVEEEEEELKIIEKIEGQLSLF